MCAWPRVRGVRAGHDPPHPGLAQGLGEHGGQRAAAVDEDAARGAARQHGIPVVVAPVGARQGVGVRPQGRPLGPGQASQVEPIGGAVDGQGVGAERGKQGGDALRRYAALRRPRGGGGLVEAAVEPLEQLDLVIAQAVEHDAHAGVLAQLDLAAAAPQGAELLLQAGPRDHRAPPAVRRCGWSAQSGTGTRAGSGVVHRASAPGSEARRVAAGHGAARERREGRARAVATVPPLASGCLRSGLAEDAVEVGAAHGAHALGHAAALVVSTTSPSASRFSLHFTQ